MHSDRALFSPEWYRVAGLRPRLRIGVVVRHRRSRGRPWVLLIDDMTHRVHRLDDAAWRFVGLCNGERSVAELWEAALAAGHGLTQGEAVALLVQLRDAGLLQLDLPSGADGPPSPRTGAAAVNPFAFRLPLGDPHRLLDRLAPALQPLAGMPLWVAWTMLVGLALVDALVHAGALAHHGAHWLHTPRYLLLAWLAYPAMKALHELGHALAVRQFGGQVREAGLSVLLLTPVPYIDASWANGFVRRRQRALVSAAGIMVELALASLACFAYLHLDDGLPRDLAFVVMFIGGASTLLANGNPLVRMDGYYLLTDLLDLPNLADRSRAWWTQRIGRMLRGGAGGTIQPAAGETPWLALYMPSSWAYRAAMAVWITSWLQSLQPVAAGAAAVLFAWQLVVGPALAGIAALRSTRLDRSTRRRAWGRLCMLALGLLGAVTLLPLPRATVVQGVVWLPEDAWVRPGTEGTVEQLLVTPGSMVRKGQPIARLSDEQVVADRDAARARLEALSAQLYQGLAGNEASAGAVAEQIAAARSASAALQSRVDALVLRAPADGRLVFDHPQDLAGRWVARGDAIGWVLPEAMRTVRIALPHADARDVANGVQRIELRSWDDPQRTVTAVPQLVVPAATHRLPAKALGTAYGGDVVVDPDDAQEMTAREPIATVDVHALQPLGARVGTRVSVRLVRDGAPLAFQLAAHLRQWALGRLKGAA